MFPEGVYTTMIILVYSLKWMIVYTKFHLDWLLYAVSVSYMSIYVPIIMHGLRLFIQCCLHVDIIRVIGIYHFTNFRLSTPSGF